MTKKQAGSRIMQEVWLYGEKMGQFLLFKTGTGGQGIAIIQFAASEDDDVTGIQVPIEALCDFIEDCSRIWIHDD
jgi:hypothetical protein